MSIWASDIHLGYDAFEDNAPGKVLTYLGSHVHPTKLPDRGAWLGTAHIPGHITADGRDDGADPDTPREWLRLDVGDYAGHHTVVLDREAITSLRDHLTRLLEAIDEGWTP